jgi:hypothetical protein
MFDKDKAKNDLRSFRMYKSFQVGGMRAQRRLINLLIDYWNLDAKEFMLPRQSLTITVEEIYFITSLLRRGEVLKFQCWGLSMSTVFPKLRRVAHKCQSNK